MFARPVSKRAARIARSIPSPSTSTSRLGSVRNASNAIPPKKPPHRVAGGQNSLLVGSVVLGATLALGYAFGRAENVEHAAHKTLSSAKADVKAAPSIVKNKLEEAKHTVSDSKSSSSSHVSTPPSVSATGAESPAPSIVEDDAESISSSVSDPGSISSASSSEGEEDEDPRQAAFDPVTGEINWDCPCLGGMAHGVCGEQFREAFACFVYSKEEPKGQDCIEKFRGMQECFAEHPEVYGEVMGDDEEEEIEAVSISSSGEDSDYDIVSAVEKALTGDSNAK